MKLYNVIVRSINQSHVNFDIPVIMNAYPLSHEHAVINLNSLTKYPWRLEYLEEVQ